MKNNEEPLRLVAYAANGHAWSFYVKDQASGLKLPIVEGSFTISSYGPDHEAILALECQIFANPKGDDYLRLEVDVPHLVAEQGFILLLEPPQEWRHSSTGKIIDCKIMLDGFGEEQK